MKTLRFISITAVLLVLTGCSQSDELAHLAQADASTEREISVPTRSLDDALEIAAKWFRIQDPTRSDVDKTVSDVEYLTAVRPGASTPDTLLYLINYADNRGFAIVGGPITSDKIYAFGDRGRVSLNDTITNIGLATFIRESISEMEIGTGTLPQQDNFV